MQSCRLSPSSTLDSSVHLTRAFGTVARAEPVPCREDTVNTRESRGVIRVAESHLSENAGVQSGKVVFKAVQDCEALVHH